MFLTTISGAFYFLINGQVNWIIPFITIPLLNIILLPYKLSVIRKDYFNPILIVLASLLIGTVLRSFFIISPLESKAKHLMLMGLDPSILGIGIFQIYIGISLFVVGFFSAKNKYYNYKNKTIFFSNFKRSRLIFLSWTISFLSLISGILYFRAMGLDLFTILFSEEISKKRFLSLEDGGFAALGYYRAAMDLVRIIYFLLLAYVLINKQKVKGTLLFLLILSAFFSLLFPFINSSRAQAILVFVFSFIMVYYIKGKISQKILIPGISAIIFLLVTMTFLRLQANYGDGDREDPFTIVVGSTNFLGVGKASFIAHSMPEKMDFQMGRTLFLWVVAPVPRTFWPSKPEISIGRVIGEDIYEKRDENTKAGGIPPGFITELYMNFGLFGIVVGMYFFGFYVRKFYNSLNSLRGNSVYAVLLYVLIFIPFMISLIEGDISRSLMNLFSTLIPLYVFIKFVKY